MGDLIPRERVRTSPLARIPGANRNFRYLAPLYPLAFEAFDFSGFDLIISSTSAWAKGVRFPSSAVHVCFIHTVSRFVFDYDRYVGGFAAGALARPVVAALSSWDRRAAARPTHYVANSHTVANRVREYYHRDADVLHSPADVNRFSVGAGEGDYFVVASRLLPYKRIDLAIDAARLAGVRLLVAGTGPAENALRERARGSTTTMLGFVEDAAMNALIGNARAAILPGEEDLGLVPIEAAAAGRPTIAFRGGGARETIVENVTGAFFDEQTPESLARALRDFDGSAFNPRRLREHAEQFSPSRFIEHFRSIVDGVASGRR